MIKNKRLKIPYNSILRNGEIVVRLNNNSGVKAVIYRTFESRGYKTNYKHKHFFYIVTYNKDGEMTSIHGITRDSRRKTMVKWWKENKIDVQIVDPVLFKQLIGEKQCVE